MFETLFFLGAVAVGLCFWILSLQARLRHAEEFTGMALHALRDVADGKVKITRSAEGTLLIQVVGDRKVERKVERV